MAHLVSSGDGLVVTVDRETGRERCVGLAVRHFSVYLIDGSKCHVTLINEASFLFPGDVLWSQNYGSPVVGVYLYSENSLRHAPHLSLAMETLRFLTFSAHEQADAYSSLKWSYQFVKEQASAQTQLV